PEADRVTGVPRAAPGGPAALPHPARQRPIASRACHAPPPVGRPPCPTPPARGRSPHGRATRRPPWAGRPAPPRPPEADRLTGVPRAAPRGPAALPHHVASPPPSAGGALLLSVRCRPWSSMASLRERGAAVR